MLVTSSGGLFSRVSHVILFKLKNKHKKTFFEVSNMKEKHIMKNRNPEMMELNIMRQNIGRLVFLILYMELQNILKDIFYCSNGAYN